MTMCNTVIKVVCQITAAHQHTWHPSSAIQMENDRKRKCTVHNQETWHKPEKNRPSQSMPQGITEQLQRCSCNCNQMKITTSYELCTTNID